MQWTFSKMQGAGNDFVVLDAVSQPLEITPQKIRALADRHFGIGADQVLVVENPTHPEAHFKYRIFNADGGEVEHCGNGARCFLRFVHEQGLSHRNPLKAEIATGLIELTQNEDKSVTVSMGLVRFDPSDVDFDMTDLSHHEEGQATVWDLPVGDAHTVPISVVAISNPHAVSVVPSTDTAPVEQVGALVESHPRFKSRVNVGFMQVVNRQEIKLRVYERGVGETLACGTGACAAVVSGIRRGLLDSPVLVHMQGGDLTVHWDGQEVLLQGPAVTVFTGTVDMQALVQNNPFLQG